MLINNINQSNYDDVKLEYDLIILEKEWEMIYSRIKVLIKPQTLGWFDTPQMSMKLENLS